MRPRMSFALVVLYHAPRRRLCPEKYIFFFSCWTPPPVGFAAPASFFGYFFPKRPVSTPPDVRWLVRGPGAIGAYRLVRNELIGGFETNTIDSYDPSRLLEHHVLGVRGFTFERRPCARRVRPMPHNPEAGSASQKEAIEEPIDPPCSGRLMAAFFRSKQRDKKN